MPKTEVLAATAVSKPARRRRLLVWLLPLALLTLVLGLALRQPELHSQGSYVFGTRVQLSISGVSAEQARQAENAVFSLFEDMHHSLHAWQPSELMRMNAALAEGKPFTASPRLVEILRAAQALSRESQGLFDPGIGRLIQLWGFQDDQFNDSHFPTDAAVQALMAQHPSIADLQIAADGTVSSRKRVVAVDLGGYAKGWALDLAAARLRQMGVSNALIDVGGNLLALGSKGGEPWQVGIQHPRTSGLLATLELQDGEAIGTSGDYYRYFSHGGIRYCHILDPRSGYPSRQSQTVTVLADPAAHAGAMSDGASKAPFIGGPAHALTLSRATGVNKVLMVDAAGQVWLTHAMAARLHWPGPRPVIHWLDGG